MNKKTGELQVDVVSSATDSFLENVERSSRYWASEKQTAYDKCNNCRQAIECNFSVLDVHKVLGTRQLKLIRFDGMFASP